MQKNCSADAGIIKLNQKDLLTAKEIYSIMQAAYRIEADLLHARDFHPLKRTIEEIRTSETSFHGIFIRNQLIAVIEFEQPEDSSVEIDSLVVNPSFFRRGCGRQLLEHTFSIFPDKSFLVSTGIKNLPAVQLYRNAGFAESRLWKTPCGIDMISLTRPPVEPLKI